MIFSGFFGFDCFFLPNVIGEELLLNSGAKFQR